jgi:hypothetical protein
VIVTTGDDGLLVLTVQRNTNYRVQREYLDHLTIEPLFDDDLAEAIAEEQRSA